MISRIALPIAACLVAPSAWAQNPAPAPGATVARPDPSKAIALGSPSSAGTEQWEMFKDQRIVRNVTVATITPVLPDPAKATGAAVIIAPGGGFILLSMDKEGYQVARWLADHGVAAFVLKYRTIESPRDPAGMNAALDVLIKSALARPMGSDAPPPETPATAFEDAKAAVKLVRARAGQWGIDPARVGFLGFSAGAITTLSVGLADERAARPDFIASVYGPMTPRLVPPDAPPMFVAVSLDDPIFARGSIGLIDSWRNAKRPVEAHLYETGGHGFGMKASTPSTALWIDEFHAWMAARGLLKPKD